jgi:hypothetical protein
MVEQHTQRSGVIHVSDQCGTFHTYHHTTLPSPSQLTISCIRDGGVVRSSSEVKGDGGSRYGIHQRDMIPRSHLEVS